MNDQGESTPEQASASGAARRDGSIEFSHYSLSQLQELQYTIDRSAFPLNYANLLAELDRRHAVCGTAPAHPADAGRFTTRDGLRGWVEAKRRRSPVYGFGSIEVGPEEIVLHGWQRTWLGVAQQASVSIPASSIRNAAQDDEWIRFAWQRPYRLPRHIEFRPDRADQAQSLLERLPDAQTPGFQERWSELRDFNRRLTTVSPRVWVTPALVSINMIVFITMAILTKQWGGFAPQHLMAWGANYGPLTINGQWWRLITAVFVHHDLLHVVVNMWALWNVGRLAERLYGQWVFVFLYFASGACASLTTIAWDPAHGSVGASGAIFGIFGAFLSFLSRRRTGTAVAIVRAHWLSTLAFVLFNLVSGALQVGVDNAAHVGGLISGFMLGWIVARPLDAEYRSTFPLREMVPAAALFISIAAAGLWQVRAIGVQLTIPEEYERAHLWYLNAESGNLMRWQQLAGEAGAGVISDAEVAERFEKEILPFWRSAHERLQKEASSIPAAQRSFAALAEDFVRLRSEWAVAIIDATKNSDANRANEAVKLAEQTDRAQARLDRVIMRANMDRRPRALATSSGVLWIRRVFSGNGWKCVEAPAWIDRRIGAADAKTDGPASRFAAGCLAQRLFMSGDYRALDALLERSTASLADLPDGSSTLAGVVAGLSDLFEYGGLSLEQALGHTSDWRHAVHSPLQADLVEAVLFEDWAWSVRGFGGASSVSRQAWAIFGHRTEMAAAALRETAQAGASSPLWYQLSLDVGLDQSEDLAHLRALFQQGIARFPNYLPLYGRMLRILMPRWHGSYAEVDHFIAAMVDGNTVRPAKDYELYARLYWTYASLERDDINIFDDALAHWSTMKMGFDQLQRHYPTSDAVLNAFAKFACLGGDAQEFHTLRPLLDKRPSATIWTDKVSIKSCDKKLAKVTPPRVRLDAVGQ